MNKGCCVTIASTGRQSFESDDIRACRDYLRGRGLHAAGADCTCDVRLGWHEHDGGTRRGLIEYSGGQWHATTWESV